MIVRRCTEKDIDAIYKIEKEAFSDPMQKETMEKDIKRDSYFCYALECDGIKAFLSFDRVLEEGQIISVATDTEHRNKGLAKKLFNEVIRLAAKDGIELFTLEVRCDNNAAMALYRSLGFKETGLRKGYYNNPVCDAVLMDLHLEKD